MKHSCRTIVILTFFAVFVFGVHASLANPLRPSERISLDAGWKFHFGHAANPEKDFNYSLATIFSKSGGAANTAIDARFKDSAWRSLNLPHDWAVELPFVKVDNVDVESHGYKPVGGLFPATSIGWYRKKFVVSAADSGRRFHIQFDGIFRDANIWLNGFFLGNHKSGYVPVTYDVTDFVRFAEQNVLVVRVDATQYEGWFYEGAGIYRHVWLHSKPPVHVAQDGIYATTTVQQAKAVVTVNTEIANEGFQDKNASVQIRLLERDGREAARGKMIPAVVKANSNGHWQHSLSLGNPRLWTLNDPYLYRVEVTVWSGNTLLDKQVQRLGIRTIEVKPDGVRLNGTKIKIQGVNCHQDHAGVGSAIPDALQYYRVYLLKNMGVNAYRASHHAPSPELLDACDSLGMLVMSEQRLLNSGASYMSQFETLVRRDRSRTCVFMWCIGNEEGWIQTNSHGRRIAQTMIARLRQLDSSRTCTYAADLPNVFQGVNEVIPVRGFNYRQYAVADYHAAHPQQPIIGTEMGSTVTTRGMYEKDSIRGYVPDQDITAPWWASRAETWWPLAAENNFWLGGFVWTGFDYRGEPTPYKWPNINSHFGIMDMAGFPKNIYYYYQSWWTDKDIIHISPHWNWMHKRGQPIEVWVNSNADSVELFLNRKSLGMQKMPRNSHLKWTVLYEPGILEAIGYKKGRKITAKQETTGTPSEVVITPYTTTLMADGKDVSVINVQVFDREGRPVPNADNMIRFSISGDAKIIGVGNGDPSSHEPDKCPDGAWQRSLFNGKCQVIVQAGTTPGIIRFEATAAGLWAGSTDIITVGGQQAATFSTDGKYALSGAAAKPLRVDKMIGADISYLPQLEERGIKFSDKGVQQDAIAILKAHGFNYVRLRIFNDPAQDSGYAPKKGYCNLEYTKQMAKRVKAAGMKLLLDFHYSDYWADPGKQYKPAAWKKLSFTDLKQAVYDFTKQVVGELKAQGTTPDMIQIGNEINHGILWPEGSVMNPDMLAQLLLAGTAAVKAVDPAIVMMLHVALGGQNSESVSFIDHMVARGVHFDVIGLSYYPKWHGTLEDLRDNINDLVRRYNKDLIIVEYSQRKKELHDLVMSVPGGRGKGTCIWEPLSTWEALFDRDGKSNDYLDWYDEISRKFLQ